ncbi:MAG: ABC transporter permease [Kiritimatiellia bacterium]|jgi:lipopolysaccharide transport system permease protein|nr:ABC transporter permease [Kiritimatiellia bacterium]
MGSKDITAEVTTLESWDTVISPHAGWFDLHLRDLWRYRDLILLFVRRDFVAQYKQTILGPLWFIIQPLLATVVFTIVFGNIAGLSTDNLPKPLFYLSGQVIWGYFAGSLTATSGTFTANAAIFGKVYFPRLAVPISIVISQLFQFALKFAFLLCFMLYFISRGATVQPSMAVFLLPVLVAIMACLALGLGIIFSSMTTKYRDLRFLLTFGIQLLMYATTAIYPLSSLQGKYRLLILANPMTSIIETFRYAFFGRGTFNLLHLAYSAGFAVVVLFIGIIFFTKIERTFMDTV